ncbi:hypothetical protein BC826DRAFT_1152970 [Russula brevipes]|nr:hypothetical protein BC826DRAFT_1152970 [Russula brevipes]
MLMAPLRVVLEAPRRQRCMCGCDGRHRVCSAALHTTSAERRGQHQTAGQTATALQSRSALDDSERQGELPQGCRCRHDGDASGEQHRPSCWETTWVCLAKALNIADGAIACGARITVADTKRRGEPPWGCRCRRAGPHCWQQTTGRTILGVAGADAMVTAAVQAELLVTANKLYQRKDAGCAITYIVCTLAHSLPPAACNGGDRSSPHEVANVLCASSSTAPYAPSDGSPPPQWWEAGLLSAQLCAEGSSKRRGEPPRGSQYKDADGAVMEAFLDRVRHPSATAQVFLVLHVTDVDTMTIERSSQQNGCEIGTLRICDDRSSSSTLALSRHHVGDLVTVPKRDDERRCGASATNRAPRREVKTTKAIHKSLKREQSEIRARMVVDAQVIPLGSVSETRRGRQRTTSGSQMRTQLSQQQHRPSCWDTVQVSLAKALNIADSAIACVVLLETPRPTPNGGANLLGVSNLLNSSCAIFLEPVLKKKQATSHSAKTATRKGEEMRTCSVPLTSGIHLNRTVLSSLVCELAILDVPPSFMMAGRTHISNNSLIIATVSESVSKMRVSSAARHLRPEIGGGGGQVHHQDRAHLRLEDRPRAPCVLRHGDKVRPVKDDLDAFDAKEAQRKRRGERAACVEESRNSVDTVSIMGAPEMNLSKSAFGVVSDWCTGEHGVVSKRWRPLPGVTPFPWNSTVTRSSASISSARACSATPSLGRRAALHATLDDGLHFPRRRGRRRRLSRPRPRPRVQRRDCRRAGGRGPPATPGAEARPARQGTRQEEHGCTNFIGAEVGEALQWRVAMWVVVRVPGNGLVEGVECRDVEALEDLASALAGVAWEAAGNKTVENADRTATQDETSASDWVQRDIERWKRG